MRCLSRITSAQHPIPCVVTCPSHNIQLPIREREAPSLHSRLVGKEAPYSTVSNVQHQDPLSACWRHMFGRTRLQPTWCSQTCTCTLQHSFHGYSPECSANLGVYFPAGIHFPLFADKELTNCWVACRTWQFLLVIFLRNNTEIFEKQLPGWWGKGYSCILIASFLSTNYIYLRYWSDKLCCLVDKMCKSLRSPTGFRENDVIWKLSLPLKITTANR